MSRLFIAKFSSVDVLLASTDWIPPQGFLYALLVLGAFLIAGVALLILSFYEDHYWSDPSYRKQLRWNHSKAKEKA